MALHIQFLEEEEQKLFSGAWSMAIIWQSFSSPWTDTPVKDLVHDESLITTV